MELLRKSKNLLYGSLAGSFISFLGPVTPLGFNGPTYTLEELAYQASENESPPKGESWSFQWVHPTGFVLRKSSHNERFQSPQIRHAVYRSVVDN
jgi:hypothetical protein